MRKPQQGGWLFSCDECVVTKRDIRAYSKLFKANPSDVKSPWPSYLKQFNPLNSPNPGPPGPKMSKQLGSAPQAALNRVLAIQTSLTWTVQPWHTQPIDSSQVMRPGTEDWANGLLSTFQGPAHTIMLVLPKASQGHNGTSSTAQGGGGSFRIGNL